MKVPSAVNSRGGWLGFLAPSDPTRFAHSVLELSLRPLHDNFKPRTLAGRSLDRLVANLRGKSLLCFGLPGGLVAFPHIRCLGKPWGTLGLASSPLKQYQRSRYHRTRLV